MGWFSDAVSSVSDFVAPVVNVVTAPVEAVKNIASGENVLESVGKAVAAPYTVAQSYLDKSGIDLSGVPLVGGIVQKNISSGAAINDGSGGFRELTQFGLTSAAGAGGYLAGSALAGAGALTASNVGLGILGTKVLSGDKTALYGALSGLTGLPADTFYEKTDPNFNTQDLGDFLQSDDGVPGVQSLTKGKLGWQAYALIGGVLLTVFIIAKRKK